MALQCTREKMLRFVNRLVSRPGIVRKHSTHTAIPVQQENVESNPLLDTYGRNHTYLRISLTERCNLRCKYCMPSEGVNLSPSSQLLTTDEILYLSSIFVKQGIRKIRLTGGEPTIRKDLPDIIQGLKALPGLTEGVAITTNGLMLLRQLVTLQKAGLDSLNVSLDTFRPTRYESMTRRRGLERVLAGIDLALQLDYKPVKVNCVVMRDVNHDEVVDFVSWTKDRAVDVRFIEYMPFDGNQWGQNKLVPYKELIQLILKQHPDLERLQDGPNDTSKAFRVPGHKGQIGFITSLTDHFCGSCNRLRLTADGNLKVCLFGNTEISLRDAIRSGCKEDDLVSLIGAAVRRKRKQHADGIKQKRMQMSVRQFSQLSHVDEKGQAKMVNVGEKLETRRRARASATVHIGKHIAKLIAENNMKKGDVLTVAQLAGVMGAKKTSQLIPLCHNIVLDHVSVKAVLQDEKIEIMATAECSGKTGVEMEALTAATIAALTVYDMCKAISHDITITDIRLVEKTGGRNSFHR